MRPLSHLALLRCFRCPSCCRPVSPYSQLVIRNGSFRQFTSLPPRLNDGKPQITSNSPNSNGENTSHAPAQNADSSSPIEPPSPQAYPSPETKKPSLSWSLITSKDWHHIESKIPPVTPRDWLDSDDPVPLDKDWPRSRAEFSALPPEAQSRVLHEELRRERFDFIRGEKLYDHTHLHPLEEPMVMPMVAPYCNYAPEA